MSKTISITISIKISIIISNHQRPLKPFCAFCDKKSVSSAFQKKQTINIHPNPFVPFVIKRFFKFLKFFKSVFQKIITHKFNFQTNITSKKSVFYSFNPFHPCSKIDKPSTSTQTLLCLL